MNKGIKKFIVFLLSFIIFIYVQLKISAYTIDYLSQFNAEIVLQIQVYALFGILGGRIICIFMDTIFKMEDEHYE